MVKTVFKRFLLSLFIIGIGLWWVGSGKGLAVIRALESQTSYGLYVRLLAQDLLELRHELTIGVALNETTQTVSLKLSAEDISAFRETYSKSLPEGYLRDSHKEKRKIKINWRSTTDSDSSAQASIHGTSLSPLKISYGALRNLLPWETNMLAPSRGGWSFKTKLSESELHWKARRINLLSPFDDWSLGSAVINEIARNHGVITPQEHYSLLKINGYVVGVYLAQEKIDKVMLERDHAITNFAVLKANDDWDTPDERHSSVFIKNIDIYEVDGSADNAELLAVEAFQNILEALNGDDLQYLVGQLDVDSFAKVSAIQKIYGTNHSTSGDNAKYIYDASKGKLIISFRAEGSPEKLKNDQRLDFTLSNYQSNPILEVLENDQDFITRRNKYLAKIINEVENINKIYDAKVSELIGIDDPTFTTSVVNYRSALDRETINHNIEILSNHLEYTKVYVLESAADSDRIMVDGYQPIVMRGCGVERVLEPSNRVSTRYNLLDIPNDCRQKMIFVGADNEAIDQKHIYWKSKASTSLPEIVPSNEIFEKEDGVFVVGPGEVVLNNSFKFPAASSVVIQPGTTIKLGDGVSIHASGNFSAVGTKSEPIIIKRSLKNKPFGSVALIGDPQNPIQVTLSNFKLEGGSEAEIESVYFSSQMSIHGAVVDITDSSFSNSVSDDGLNVKYSKVVIANSEFFDNYGDQIDLDFCSGSVSGSLFRSSKRVSDLVETDGLDLSGSTIEVFDSSFYGFSDKGLSVGEESNVWINENEIRNNKFGIAVKDGSNARLANNTFSDNLEDVAQYVKKPFFAKPVVEGIR